jgi:Helicase associated domain
MKWIHLGGRRRQSENGTFILRLCNCITRNTVSGVDSYVYEQLMSSINMGFSKQEFANLHASLSLPRASLTILFIFHSNELGHCDVPATYKDKQLANWVQLTRKKYKHVKLKELETSLGNNQSFSSYMPTSSVASLAKDQILKLDKIGFSYDVRGEYDDKYIEYLRNPC